MVLSGSPRIPIRLHLGEKTFSFHGLARRIGQHFGDRGGGLDAVDVPGPLRSALTITKVLAGSLSTRMRARFFHPPLIDKRGVHELIASQHLPLVLEALLCAFTMSQRIFVGEGKGEGIVLISVGPH